MSTAASSPRRILFLVSSMHGGGAERVAASLCNHWAEREHEVTLMPTYSGGGECLYPLDDRVCLDFLADRVQSTSKSSLNAVHRFMVLRRAIRELRPDVIISFFPHVNVAAVFASRGLDVPVMVAERIYPPAVALNRFLECLRKLSYSLATGVVMQTEQGLQWLEAYCPKAIGHVIANPALFPLPVVEPKVAPSSVLCESRQVLLAVGRLVPQKGFHSLLDSYAALAARFTDWDLVILGEGGEREHLEAKRRVMGLEGRVHFPGRVGNLSDWYRRAAVYVMSSRFEGFPNTLVEAMAHGLPAVSVDCDTGPRDIIRHGVDGLLVGQQSDTAGLTQALASMMGDTAARERMAEAAVSVRDRFAMERIASQWDDVLGLRA